MKINYPVKDIHTLSIVEVLHSFETDGSAGISQSEAEKRSREFGLNIYTAQKQQGIWLLLVHQFKSLIVYLLVFGAGVSLFYKDYIDAIAIAAVILINALIGFLMELQARNSMKALREMDVILSTVIRDGKTLQIPSEKLTPGDIVLFEAGDVIPGDGRLLETNQLQCDESSLTGESIPSVKNTGILPKDTVTGDMLNMVFKGTSVMNGKGKAVITGIAHNTELGTITSLVDSSTETVTPLDKKINALSRKLIWITLIMTLIFAITGFIQGKKWLLIIETAIALAVAAIPEGLPIVSTIALAYGMLLMARRNAIVKKLSSVETLGSTNVILTDKTGTLTENKIYIETICFPEEDLQVTIENNHLKIDRGQLKKSTENFEKLRLTGALCNNVAAKNEDSRHKLLGDPIEIALIRLANTEDCSAETFQKQYQRIAEVPFNSDTKMMATLHKNFAGYFVAAKGSVEQLLEKCDRLQSGTLINPMSAAERKTILGASEKMAAGGLRVLAFGYKEAAEMNHEHYLDDLVYIGMIGFLDPPRLDIKPAILSCRKAGIKIVMITGDHPMTALNIARKTGLIDEGDQKVITGKDIPSMDSLSAEWKERILSTAIFARTTPRQKLDIANVYQMAGNIVAMTGDGVNDAPALKKADVGIAMGLRGTPVAKETASIILKDDSFTSIAAAVAYGRTIFQNIQKFVIYLVSCNLSEILIVTVLGFIAPAAALLPLQILFLNMVTDVFPALALGIGKKNDAVMLKPPRDPAKDIISNKDWISIVLYAAVITLSVILAVFYCKLIIGADSKSTNNAAFITLAFAQLFHVFNMSAPNAGLLNNEITRNKFVWIAVLLCAGLMALVYMIPQTRLVLNLAVLPVKVWAVSLLAAMLPLLLVQLYKGIWKIRKPYIGNLKPVNLLTKQ
jgi:P-type Ca2+ transporter type 2C